MIVARNALTSSGDPEYDVSSENASLVRGWNMLSLRRVTGEKNQLLESCPLIPLARPSPMPTTFLFPFLCFIPSSYVGRFVDSKKSIFAFRFPILLYELQDNTLKFSHGKIPAFREICRLDRILAWANFFLSLETCLSVVIRTVTIMNQRFSMMYGKPRMSYPCTPRDQKSHIKR